MNLKGLITKTILPLTIILASCACDQFPNDDYTIPLNGSANIEGMHVAYNNYYKGQATTVNHIRGIDQYYENDYNEKCIGDDCYKVIVSPTKLKFIKIRDRD